MSKNKQWYIMDYLKFFFSLCIIALHVEMLQSFSALSYWIEKGIFRVGVPFFMIASGFLLGSKLYQVRDDFSEVTVKPIIVKFSKRLLKMLIVFEPISLILNWFLWGMKGASVIKILLRSIRSIVFYPLGALWYIQAMLVGVWLAYFFIIRKKVLMGIAIGSILYIIALLCNSYYFVLEGSFFQVFVDIYLKCCESARNGLFYGFFMIMLGIVSYYLYERKIKKMGNNVATKILGSGVLVFYVGYLIELFLLRKKTMADDGALFVMLPFLACAMVLFSALFCSESTKSILFRNLSTGMYLLHRPIISVYTIVTMALGIYISQELNFVITALLSFSICMLAYQTPKLEKYLK